MIKILGRVVGLIFSKKEKASVRHTQRVTEGTDRVVKEYRRTFERLVEYDRAREGRNAN